MWCGAAAQAMIELVLNVNLGDPTLIGERHEVGKQRRPTFRAGLAGSHVLRATSRHSQ